MDDRAAALHPLSQRVLAAVSGGDDRTAQVSQAIVRHLHALILEVHPTLAEWRAAIDFLTAAGHMTTDTRQEFILLSDTLGASMLVDELNGMPGGTESTILGPFHVDDPPEAPSGADLTGGAPGRPMRVEARILSESGMPIPGARVDTWQSDGDGLYDVQILPEYRLRARLTTDDEGRFGFRSVVPVSYPLPTDGPVGAMLRSQGRHPYRPAHVHFKVTAPGYRELITHLFLDGDVYLDSDVVFGVRSGLVVRLEADGDGHDGALVLRRDLVLTEDRCPPDAQPDDPVPADGPGHPSGRSDQR